MTARNGWIRETVVQYRGDAIRTRKIGGARNVVDMLAEIGTCTPHDLVESFVVLSLDARNRVIGWQLVSRGGTSACAVAVADTFRPAIVAGATGVVFAHNHPSGDPTPSAEDIALTERFAKAGDLLGIRVLDHVINASEGHFSFLDAGLLRPQARV